MFLIMKFFIILVTQFYYWSN